MFDQTSLVRELPEEHHCAWREEAEELAGRLSSVEQQLAKLSRAVFGQKSEKMKTPAEELRRETPATPELAQAKRQERADAKSKLLSREILHTVPEKNRHCPKCHRTDLKPLGKGKVSVLYEYVPGYFERQVHTRETLACACGEGIVTADGPTRVADKSGYGPGFLAHVVTAKCADSIPLYRMEKSFAREGVPVVRSTLVDLFHTAAVELESISTRLLEKVAEQRVVQGDETPLKVLAKEKCRTGFLWTFLAQDEKNEDELVGYRFSPSRAGTTPVEVLGGTQGCLVVDAYTGYNKVTAPDGRERVGCWAHVRRKFFEALLSTPKAQEAMGLILDLYRVEAAAKEAGLLRSPAHLALRQTKSAEAVATLWHWLEEEAPKHLPKSPLGVAIRYAQTQWPALTRFIEDTRLPLDNNKSERALRVAALGRKNFLFVGNNSAGQKLAGLYSLVATCEANGVNPREYLKDVLIRVQSHPAHLIDELLPGAWARNRALNSS